jgi:hypothetical protein
MATAPDFDAKGFLRSLYDFGFTSLITTRIIRFVYALIVIVLSLGSAFFLLATLASGEPSAAVFGIIVIPLAYLLYLVMARIWMEFVIVVFRIGDDIHAIRNRGDGPALGGGFNPRAGEPPWPPRPPS